MNPPTLQKETRIVTADGRPTQYFLNYLLQALPKGYTGTIATAALTGGGANGSITFQNGVVVAQTPAT
jgi:hypothetical protein